MQRLENVMFSLWSSLSQVNSVPQTFCFHTYCHFSDDLRRNSRFVPQLIKWIPYCQSFVPRIISTCYSFRNLYCFQNIAILKDAVLNYLIYIWVSDYFVRTDFLLNWIKFIRSLKIISKFLQNEISLHFSSGVGTSLFYVCVNPDSYYHFLPCSWPRLRLNYFCRISS